jgi:hypothetical protein
MILTCSESNVQLTYTFDEQKEFACAIEAFRREINTTLRKEISALRGPPRERHDEFIESLDYIDSTMIIARSHAETDIREFEEFIENIGVLRIYLTVFQKWYHDRGEHENSQDLIDRRMLLVLQGKKVIVGS